MEVQSMEELSQQQPPANTNSNFLEVSFISEMIELMEQIEANCKGKIGENIINLRIRQLAYAKILCNTFNKDIAYLIKAYAQLGTSYMDIEYYEQAQEHLLNAFKLNDNLTEENSINMKEYQIQILINLSRCYLENDKINPALQISERSLKMNQSIFGKDHISNCNIYSVIAKANSKLGNYSVAIENLKEIHALFSMNPENKQSEMMARLYMEMADNYDKWNMINDSIDYYSKAYSIWEILLNNKNDNNYNNTNDYEIFFNIAMKLGELHSRNQNGEEAYKILCKTEDDYDMKVERSAKHRFVYQKLRIKYSESVNNIGTQTNQDLYLEEHLRLEAILNQTNENQKALAKTCVSIGCIYLNKRNKNKCLEYFSKAEKIFSTNKDVKNLESIQNKIFEIQEMNFINEEDELKADFYYDEI